MKRPSFQFYPADWRNNAKLRRCSEAARGAWMDIMGILHDSDEYGVARYPLAELARAAGVKISSARELVDKGVLKGADRNCAPYVYTPRSGGKEGEAVSLIECSAEPCWYSTRMVRDEYMRLNRGGETRFTSSNQPNAQKPSPSVGTERAKLRARVFEKTGGFCFHCKEALSQDWEIDHFIPRAKGGSSKLVNLVPSCRFCNQDKLDTNPSDWLPPSRRVGERQGDGSTTSSPSSSAVQETPSLRSGDARKSRPKASKRGLPENFPDEDTRKWAEQHWLAKGRADLCALMDEEAEKFRDHHVSNAKTSADWPASWRTWCKNAMNFSKVARNGGTHQPAKILSIKDLGMD